MEPVVERAAELVTLVLVGAFNVDMMETRNNQALVNILSASGLVNHVAQPQGLLVIPRRRLTCSFPQLHRSVHVKSLPRI